MGKEGNAELLDHPAVFREGQKVLSGRIFVCRPVEVALPEREKGIELFKVASGVVLGTEDADRAGFQITGELLEPFVRKGAGKTGED